MLKKRVKYEDFDGNEQEDIFYFNLSKPELFKMESETDAGMKKMLETLLEKGNPGKILETYKEILLLAYGHKTEDGKHFEKSPEIRRELETHAAYPYLYMELIESEKAAGEFIDGVFPKDMVQDMKEKERVSALQKPPSPPSS